MATPSTESVIGSPVQRFRAPVARGVAFDAAGKPRIDRTGGRDGVGKIYGVSVITQGEALGHRRWIDAYAVNQVADAINASTAGVKSRFAHPGLSADGMGKMLGRISNAVVDGQSARADLEFTKAATDSPDGDLAKYVMDLAESDPEHFGVSIAFTSDWKAEEEFIDANTAESNLGDKHFISPDPGNTKRYRHVRLKELHAGDVVDEPAANPNGLFHRGQEIPTEADALVAFALGVSDAPPDDPAFFGVDPERLRGFAQRFLESHKLRLAPLTEPPADPSPPVDPVALCRQFVSKFGAVGAEWFAAGKTYAEALELHAAALTSERDALADQFAKAQSQLQTLRGEKEPLKFSPPPPDDAKTARRSKLSAAIGPKLAVFASELSDRSAAK